MRRKFGTDKVWPCLTWSNHSVSLDTRQKLLLESFTTQSGTESPSSQSPLAVLVKRLQESLTRLENFEVVTVSQGEDSKRGAASMLARQLRLRLVAAEGTTVPRNCTNITVSIHAIATFQALHDYLRPRVAGVGPGSSSRLHGVLAAFAAATGLPSSALGRHPNPSALLNALGGAASMPPPPTAGSSSVPAAISSASTPAPAPAASAPPAVERRRSLRLRKEPPAPADDPAPAAPPAADQAIVAPAPVQPASVAAPPLDMSDDDLEDDFLDDEFDHDVVDDAPAPANERTVSVAVGEGSFPYSRSATASLTYFSCTDGQKVEAQTPEGTRVATPSGMPPPPSASSSSGLAAAKASYASALKAKPTDWHLEFSMDDHPLPLDMTVYGAVHQHLLRKENEASPLSSLWNGQYVIKFKKVNGPVPVEGAHSGSSVTKVELTSGSR